MLEDKIVTIEAVTTPGETCAESYETAPSACKQLAAAQERRVADYPPPAALLSEDEFTWNDDESPVDNYAELGRRLAVAGDLYRRPGYASGLLFASGEANIAPAVIAKGALLAPLIVDRLRVRVMQGGEVTDRRIPNQHLNTMLATEAFLQSFRPVDEVTTVAHFLADFNTIQRGYNDGGPGQRLLYVGPDVQIVSGTEAIDAFLDVMAFATNADRTNAVALAVTVMLRNFWPGAKPVAIISSTKSHGGKGTIVAFAAGSTPTIAVDYQSADWAFRNALFAALQSTPGVGVVHIDNARLGAGEKSIKSATLERLTTDPEPVLSSSKARDAIRIRNHLVPAITTNFGTVSEDLWNRGLPIHMNPIGNVADRVSPIGNPKLEYLSANRECIEAELRGMIEKWKAAGRPLDMNVKHPFSDWARTIGGILMVNGYRDFLGNYSLRKTADDPIRRGLGILGATCPDQWLRAGEWAEKTVFLGLLKTLIPAADRETDTSRERGIGIVMTAHRDETFVAETDDAIITLRLEKKRARFDGGEPTTRYRFVLIAREPLPVDDESPNGTAHQPEQ